MVPAKLWISFNCDLFLTDGCHPVGNVGNTEPLLALESALIQLAVRKSAFYSPLAVAWNYHKAGMGPNCIPTPISKSSYISCWKSASKFRKASGFCSMAECVFCYTSNTSYLQHSSEESAWRCCSVKEQDAGKMCGVIAQWGKNSILFYNWAYCLPRQMNQPD